MVGFDEEKRGYPEFAIIGSFYDHHLFLVEELLNANMESFELGILTSATLCSVIYDFPSFNIQEHDTQTDLVAYYHATSDPRYKLFQLLINGLQRQGVEIFWLQAPIFFGQL